MNGCQMIYVNPQYITKHYHNQVNIPRAGKNRTESQRILRQTNDRTDAADTAELYIYIIVNLPFGGTFL